MKEKMKKILAAILATFALLVNTTYAFAGADADASVGDDGDAVSDSFDNDSTIVDNSNDGDLTNADLCGSSSGGNTQSGNDDGNSMGTGDAECDAESANFLHSNVTEVGDDEDGSADANSAVGEDGDATATADDSDDVSVDNTNDGSIDNATLTAANSGGNDQSGNDDGNSMTTGDAMAMAAALNELNSNWTMVAGSHSATATASVGDDGDAVADAFDNDSTMISNSNGAILSNASLAAASSGGNTQSGNDDDNDLDTGDAEAGASANNFVNNNVTVVGGSDGGSADADASVGEDGTATATADDSDDVSVTNTNDADVLNVSDAIADSGGNDQSDNDDGNSMTTGKATGKGCSSNTVNSNWTSVGGSLPAAGDNPCD